MIFIVFVMFDMFNVFVCCFELKLILRGEVGLFSNILFNWVVSLSMLG